MATKAKCSLIALLSAILAFGIAKYVVCPEDTGSCGPKSLWFVANVLGRTFTETEVLGRFARQGKFVSLGELEFVAKQMGFDTTCRNITVSELNSEKPLGILHIDGHHFVALTGYSNGAVLVQDPIYGTFSRPFRIPMSDLSVRWDGAILTIKQSATEMDQFH